MARLDGQGWDRVRAERSGWGGVQERPSSWWGRGHPRCRAAGGGLVWEVEGHWLSSGSQELALSWEAWAVMGRKPLWGRWQEEVL